MRNHLSLGRRLEKRHLQPAFSSCLNHCAWPRAWPEPVPPLLVLGFALMLSVTMRRSFLESLTFSIFAVGNDTGPGLRVCYSFKQFLWRIFFNIYFIICWKNCNAAHVWWCKKWYRFVTKVRKNTWWSHTWWIIAINVKYAYAAKASCVLFCFSKCLKHHFIGQQRWPGVNYFIYWLISSFQRTCDSADRKV